MQYNLVLLRSPAALGSENIHLFPEAASLWGESEQPRYGGCCFEAANWLPPCLALILISIDDTQGEALVTRHHREPCEGDSAPGRRQVPAALGSTARRWAAADWPRLLGLRVSPVVGQAEAKPYRFPVTVTEAEQPLNKGKQASWEL